MGDKVRDKNSNIVAVFAGITDSSASLVCTCGKDAIDKGAHAGKIVKEVSAITGGKGGGRPDSAMAGIGDTAKIDNAFAKLSEIIGSIVK